MRRRPRALLATALTTWMTTSLALASPPWGRSAIAGETERVSLHGELGAEYDSNAQRTEIVDRAQNPTLVASPLGRGVLTGQLSDVIAAHQTLALSATIGGKWFQNDAARSENVAIAASSLNWRAALTDTTGVGLLASYYEAFQSDSDAATTGTTARLRGDFRSLIPTARLARRLGDSSDLTLSAGYRLLMFKPNPDYTFGAPTGALDLHWMTDDPDRGVDWDIGVGGSYEHRDYDGNALGLGSCPTATAGFACPLTITSAPRRDHFATGHVELTRTGAVLLGAGYVLQWNRSNSYGETLQRHFISLRLTAGLPLGLYLAARGELLLARYADPVVIGTPSTVQTNIPDIDRENRSSVRVDLSRALTDRWQLIARYTAYVNELGSAVGRYHRQTALLSLAFTVDK